MDINHFTTVASFIPFTLLVFFFAITLAVRYRKRKQENETLKNMIVTERLKIQVEIQDETLQHVSRELHDNLAHTASLIKINLNTTMSSEDSVRAKLEYTKELTRQLITDIKQLSLRLGKNPVIEKGLIGALEMEAEKINMTGAFNATFFSEPDIPQIPVEKAIVLFRMAQEGINNIIKHSNASDIIIKLTSSDKIVKLVLIDNGIGFDTQKQVKDDSAGLSNLRNRAQLLHAVLQIKSRPGEGTEITIKLPSA